jgi:acetoin utilization protein AcuB
MASPADRLIGDVMVTAPHTIDVGQPVGVARRKMNRHRIRHLPVVHGTELVGMITERDLALAESLRSSELETLCVEDVMTTHPYAISSSTSLEWVALDMAEHKYSSAVVVDSGRVVGVFTTVDALRALSEILGQQRRS